MIYCSTEMVKSHFVQLRMLRSNIESTGQFRKERATALDAGASTTVEIMPRAEKVDRDITAEHSRSSVEKQIAHKNALKASAASGGALYLLRSHKILKEKSKPERVRRKHRADLLVEEKGGLRVDRCGVAGYHTSQIGYSRR